jgi:hypothetical protein
VGQKHLLPRPHRSSPIHDASVAFPKMERNEIKRIWLTSATSEFTWGTQG